ARVAVRPWVFGLPPGPALFPYTSLFRSLPCARTACCRHREQEHHYRTPARAASSAGAEKAAHRFLLNGHLRQTDPRRARPRRCRSEEHTSELQSRENLVCRLLLEKKKNE